MNQETKKAFKIMSFVPLIAYTICSVYYLFLIRPLMHHQEMDDHGTLNEITANHFTSLTWMVCIATVLAAVLFFYCLYYLLRLRDMAVWDKIGWMVFLVFFGAFAFPVFWYYSIRTEPRNVRMKDSID